MSPKASILLVDDDSAALTLMAASLNRLGLRIFSATNGEKALEILQAKPSIDLVITDVVMPVMDGLQATRHIKGCWPQIKVIVLSMYGDYQVAALAAGADAFMGKGESPERVLDRIAQVLYDRLQT